MKKALIFGGGSIGRGFLGELFHRSGYRVVFVDVVPAVVKRLNEAGSYDLWVVSDEKTVRTTITGVSAVSAGDPEAVARELAGAGIAATAVGVNNLAGIAPLLAGGIKRRAAAGAGPLNIIICENLLSAGPFLRSETARHLSGEELGYLEQSTGFVETVVSRMVPPVPADLKAKHPMLVMVEPYSLLPVAASGFKGPLPEITGFLPVPDIGAYEERKLYIHNLGHSACAYAGYLRGMQYIWETVRDGRIRAHLFSTLDESSRALGSKYPFLREEMAGHISDLVNRFGNRALGDTVFRVGREPIRKLGPRDRLVGALRLCREQGVAAPNICRTIACALRFDYADDAEAQELQRMLARQGLDFVLTKVAGLTADDPGRDEIRAACRGMSGQSA